jgi:hypothetical protein
MTSMRMVVTSIGVMTLGAALAARNEGVIIIGFAR